MRGVLSGVVFGLLVGGGTLVVASLAAPQPPGNTPPAAPEVTAPAGAAAPEADEAPQTPAEAEAVPEVDAPAAPGSVAPEAAPEADVAAAVPQAGGLEAEALSAGSGAEESPEAPATGAAPERVATPELGTAAGAEGGLDAESATPPSPAALPDAAVSDAAPAAPATPDMGAEPAGIDALPGGDAGPEAGAPGLDAPDLPALPGEEAAPEIASAPAPALGEAPAPAALGAPEAGSLPEGEPAEESPVLPNPQSAPPAAPALEAEPEVAEPAELPDMALPEPDDAPEQTADAPQVIARTGTGGGLPGASSGPPVLRLGDAEAEDEVLVAPVPEEGALSAYAAPFEGSDLPLLTVLLFDDGSLPPSALGEIEMPLTVLIDPSRPDAGAAATAWRAAGYEVAAIARLPAGATPQDVEVALEAVFGALPEAVALVDAGGLTAREPVAEQTMARLAADGRGFVALDEGLGTARREAEAADVPSAAIYRDLDAEGQDARVIRRFLDQAAFQARNGGGVVLLARLRPDTISALSLWETANRAAQVSFAPLSAVLLGE
ncbi:divergent polysaccharide deacetylase family protein [Pseudoroseicyclus sp. CXY001]|uniref:divergent polysaccharide deacetylase family protein n=1 Tax=Pseudoroseicyclus sp. CXY001 TaxID=3242492 RepID=UPI003570E30B